MALGRKTGRGRAKPDHVAPFAPTCPAGKVGFLSRKDARRFAKQRTLSDLQAYLCNHDGCRYWHLGHLPPLVVAGERDRHDLNPAKPPHRRSRRSP